MILIWMVSMMSDLGGNVDSLKILFRHHADDEMIPFVDV